MKIKLFSFSIGLVCAAVILVMAGFNNSSDKYEYMLISYSHGDVYTKQTGLAREPVSLNDKKNGAGEFVAQISIYEEIGWELYSFHVLPTGTSGTPYYSALLRLRKK